MSERLTTYHCGKAVIKDKNKLSEAMEKLAEFEEKEKCGEWLDAIELAKIAIALQSQKWIPCSERLPKKPERGENGYIVQKKRVAEPFSAYWDGERWKLKKLWRYWRKTYIQKFQKQLSAQESMMQLCEWLLLHWRKRIPV